MTGGIIELDIHGEGDFVNAYFNPRFAPGDPVLLGSIHKAGVTPDSDRFKAWQQVMTDCVIEVLKLATDGEAEFVSVTKVRIPADRSDGQDMPPIDQAKWGKPGTAVDE